MNKMPALFIGHGSPMNTLADNTWTRAWQAWGSEMPRPEALLLISAHWYLNATAVTAMAQPRTIHDFYGFPQALFDFQYPAPGAPDLAHDIIELLSPVNVVADYGQWGFDHGTWSVLAHMYPAADIPVVQLSIDGLQPLEYHLQLAARLAVLRQRGVLVIGSGNVVHNLPLMQRSQTGFAYDWAQRFDDAVVQQMHEAPGDALRLLEHPDYKMAVPTPDHFIPLLYVAGLAAAENSSLSPIMQACTMGAISMTSFRLG